MPNIAVLTVGINESPLLGALVEIPHLKYQIICSNLLDFELPPLVENAAPQWHRHELRNVLHQIGPDKFEISQSLQNLLKENDRLDLDEKNLALTSHITQIEQNSNNLFVAYELLREQTGHDNIELIPLVKTIKQLLVFKNKKYAPLRYYYLKNSLLKEEPPAPEDKSKRKYDDKKLTIENLDYLKNVKLSEPALKAMTEADLIVILPTDVVSLAILVGADELEKQIKDIETPLVLVWPYEDEIEHSDEEIEITSSLESGVSLADFAGELSFLTDYIIIPKSQKGKIENLRETGCHVLMSDFIEENGNVSPNLIESLFNVADLDLDEEESEDVEAAIDNDVPTEESETEDITEDKVEDEQENENSKSSGKTISQLVESPEEAGIEKIKEEIPIEDVEEGDQEDIDAIIKDLHEAEIEETDDELEAKISDDNETIPKTPNGVVEMEEEIDPEFGVREEEEWIDAAKRAIEECFHNEDEEALEWLINQSKSDSDREVQIAELSVNEWIDSRSLPDRRKGAEIVSKLSEGHRETYLQILQRHMFTAVNEMQEDRRRLLIPLFSLLHDVDINLTELLVRGITKDLATVKEDQDIAVVELAKLTILQLVILSRRLSRVAINELLAIVDNKPNIGPEIWNILTSFDAGTISLELVTNFSINKAEEIIRRSNMLRFTGSFYSTISRVIQAWKDGDKAAISNATGSILPEETLRKFERLELARKLDKLKMVQLTTLAESLGKDVETVERLITELIVNDELHAEMKLIDDKMYLVSTTEATKNSN